MGSQPESQSRAGGRGRLLQKEGQKGQGKENTGGELSYDLRLQDPAGNLLGGDVVDKPWTSCGTANVSFTEVRCGPLSYHDVQAKHVACRVQGSTALGRLR